MDVIFYENENSGMYAYSIGLASLCFQVCVRSRRHANHDVVIINEVFSGDYRFFDTSIMLYLNMTLKL